MKNIKNKIIKLLAFICVILSLFAVTSCDPSSGSQPMLKLTTIKGYGMFPATTTTYYIIYENGAAKKTSKFVPSKKGSYNYSTNDIDTDSDVLNIIDNNTPQAKELNEIAKDILLFKNDPKLEIVSVNWLFVLEDRYFFVADCSDKKTLSTLFEYTPADNSAKKIVSFNNSINHVELYEPQ